MSLESAIRDEAAARGFVLCGFSAVQSPPHAAFLEQWLAQGKAAGMAYLAKGLARRLDPRLLLENIRSVITLAFPYSAPPHRAATDWQATLRGRIAAYAAGPDYHDIVLARLDEVAAAVRRLAPGARTLTYTDTGAILEREWANLGGVGWFGKNTMILHRLQGSWFFLGEILTDLAFATQALPSDHCGSCRRCLDDCPTGALEGGYSLDARLCISYLTIEHRGALPLELRPKIGNWIFGCDVCQEVCPWNGSDGDVAPDPFLEPYLPDLLALDPAAFEARFRRTALWRTKRDGLLRNAAVALGNSANRDAVAFLARSIAGDPSALVRAHAAWALGSLGGTAARRALDAARTDPDDQVRAEVSLALGE